MLPLTALLLLLVMVIKDIYREKIVFQYLQKFYKKLLKMTLILTLLRVCLLMHKWRRLND